MEMNISVMGTGQPILKQPLIVWSSDRRLPRGDRIHQGLDIEYRQQQIKARKHLAEICGLR